MRQKKNKRLTRKCLRATTLLNVASNYIILTLLKIIKKYKYICDQCLGRSLQK